MGVKEDRLTYINKWRLIKNDEAEGDWHKIMMDILNSLDEPHYSNLRDFVVDLSGNTNRENDNYREEMKKCDPLDQWKYVKFINRNVESFCESCFYRFEKYLAKNSLTERET